MTTLPIIPGLDYSEAADTAAKTSASTPTIPGISYVDSGGNALNETAKAATKPGEVGFARKAGEYTGKTLKYLRSDAGEALKEAGGTLKDGVKAKLTSGQIESLEKVAQYTGKYAGKAGEYIGPTAKYLGKAGKALSPTVKFLGKAAEPINIALTGYELATEDSKYHLETGAKFAVTSGVMYIPYVGIPLSVAINHSWDAEMDASKEADAALNFSAEQLKAVKDDMKKLHVMASTCLPELQATTSSNGQPMVYFNEKGERKYNINTIDDLKIFKAVVESKQNSYQEIIDADSSFTFQHWNARLNPYYVWNFGEHDTMRKANNARDEQEVAKQRVGIIDTLIAFNEHLQDQGQRPGVTHNLTREIAVNSTLPGETQLVEGPARPDNWFIKMLKDFGDWISKLFSHGDTKTTTEGSSTPKTNNPRNNAPDNSIFAPTWTPSIDKENAHNLG